MSLPPFIDANREERGSPEAASGYCPYGQLSYLVVEDSPTMRTWLKNAIADAGGKRIEMAENYNDALYRIRNREPFDVVLCDYILADARDGQQLLEEVRRSKLLPQSAVWIMITAERAYEQVFSAAELAPDDYILKPLTPASFGQRLERVYAKRQALRAVTDFMDADRHDEALAAAVAALGAGSPYALDFNRIIGECLLATRRYSEALAHYEKLLSHHATLPWAKLGRARAFFHLDQHDETEDILRGLMSEQPDFLKAHDLLARIHEHRGDFEASKTLLKALLSKNPKALGRQREIVRVALATGDNESAVEAYGLMHLHGKGSTFLAPGDFCTYANLLVKSGTKVARERLDQLAANLKQYHAADGGFVFSERLVKLASAQAAGDAEATGRAYRDLIAARRQTELGDNEQRMALLDVAAAMGDQATVLEMAEVLYDDYQGNTRMEARLTEVMKRAGLEAKAQEIAKAAGQRVADMNVKAVGLAKAGRLREAIDEFIRLANESRNLTVSLNAAVAIIQWLEQGGDSGQLAAKLDELIAFVRTRDPANPRLAQILEAMARLGGQPRA